MEENRNVDFEVFISRTSRSLLYGYGRGVCSEVSGVWGSAAWRDLQEEDFQSGVSDYIEDIGGLY